MNNFKNKLVGSAFLTVTLMSQSAIANSNSAWIDSKQTNQKHKIYQGFKSGELTARETWRLGQQQKDIYQKERRFKADGDFTRRERAKIHLDMAKSSKSIYQQKHDEQQQNWGLSSAIKSGAVNKREGTQAKHIGQGIRSGELTTRETARLGKQQVKIHRKERRLRSDGVFTKRERAKVHKSQNYAARSIYRAKHN